MIVSPLKKIFPNFLFNSPSTFSSAPDNTTLMCMSNAVKFPKYCFPFFVSIITLFPLDRFNVSNGLDASVILIDTPQKINTVFSPVVFKFCCFKIMKTKMYLNKLLFLIIMAIYQQRSRRKSTGAYYKKKSLTKRQSNVGRTPAMGKVSEKNKVKTIRTRGNNKKARILEEQFANIKDKNNKWQKVKMKSVVENPANRNFVRRNILTKGTIIDTEKGKAKITSRPGQDGIVNAEFI